MIARPLRLFAVLFLAACLFTWPASAQDTTCDPDADHQAIAEDHLAAGNYTLAYEAYTCALLANPEELPLYLARGNAALMAATYEENFGLDYVNDFNTVFVADPDLAEEAIERETAAIEDDPEALGAYVRRGFLYWFGGDNTRGVRDLLAAIRLEPENAFVHLLRGMTHHYMGESTKAAIQFERAAELAPDNADLMAQIALTYLNTNDLEASFPYFERALELDPDNGLYYAYRGYAHILNGDTEQALADYDAAIERNPDSAELYVSRAYAHQLLEDYEAVIDDYSRAIELNPDDDYAYQARGWTYVQEANFEDALADFVTAARLNPTEPYTYLGRGTARNALGQLERAAGDFLLFVGLIERETNDVEIGVLRPGSPLGLEMAEGRVYYLPFSATEGDTLNIAVTSPDGGVDPLIVLLNPEQRPIAGSDDVDAAAEDYSSAITDFEAPATGTYTLVVTHAGGGSSGQVEIDLEIDD